MWKLVEMEEDSSSVTALGFELNRFSPRPKQSDESTPPSTTTTTTEGSVAVGHRVNDDLSLFTAGSASEMQNFVFYQVLSAGIRLFLLLSQA